MKTRLLMGFCLMCMVASVTAQTINVKGIYPSGNVEELALMVAPMGYGDAQEIVKVVADDSVFTANVRCSTNGFYTLYGNCNGGQLIMPIYHPTTGDMDFLLRLNGNCPQVESDNNNGALSAYNLFTYQQGRKFWMGTETINKDEIFPFLRQYMNAADSIAQTYNCDASVAEYMRLWAYTSMWKLYSSVPRALKIKADDMPFTLDELLEDTKEMFKSPLAVLFPETGYIILESLPKGTMEERLSYLYDNYNQEVVCKKVADQIVESYVRRFDYSGDFEKGLSDLQAMVEKYALSSKYIENFTKRRASAKGTPFPQGITLVDVDGKPVDFSIFKGSYVYIDLWASWCGPCCKEVPHLQKLEKEIQNPNVKFVSISIDKNEKAWRAKMKMLNMHGHQFLNQDNSLAEALNVRGIPFFMIYDKEGKLYMSNAPRPSHPQLKNLLEELK